MTKTLMINGVMVNLVISNLHIFCFKCFYKWQFTLFHTCTIHV